LRISLQTKFKEYLINMLKLFGFIISIFLIVIIFLRIPQENMGLASFATKSDLLGSPSSAQRSLNIITACGIFVYFGIAIQMNLINN
jgi:preprotein translocase subunit SecG